MEQIVKKEKKFITKERVSRLVPALLVAFAVAFIVFIAAPLAIYTSNVNEFNFPFSDILGFCVLYFFIVFGVVFLVQMLLPKICYKIVRGFFIGVALMLFLQSNYLNIGLHSLAGDDIITIREMVGTANYVINTIVWAVVLVGFTLASVLLKKENIVKTISLVLSVVVLFTSVFNVVVAVVSTDFSKGSVIEELKNEEPDYVPKFLTVKNMTTVSKKRNVIVFLVDRFDGEKYFEPYKDEYKNYFKDLGGFTYFSDNISLYGRTFPSLAYMLSNTKFDSSKSRKEFFNTAYNDNKTLSKLHELNYSINLYTDPYYGYYDAFYFPDYIDNVVTVDEQTLYRETIQKKELFRANMMMSFFRVLPFFAKDVGGGVSSTSLNKFVIYNSDQLSFPAASSDMKEVYDNITENNFNTFDDKNVFSLIHLSGCHGVDYDTDWKPVKSGAKKDIKVSLDNSFAIIKEYIDEMKKLGVYENSTIIITGDHAYADDNYKKLNEEKLTAIFVKPSGDTESKLKVSSAPVCQDDLWATIFKSEGIEFDKNEFGKSMFDYLENEQRVRKYVWQYHETGKTRFVENVYEINGSAHDFDNWQMISSVSRNKELYD